MDETRPVLGTTGFLLSKIGPAVTERFAAKIAPLGLRPNLFGLLAVASAASSPSQQDLGRMLGLVPSALVPMVDDLERMGAVRRVPVEGDRRRYAVEVTEVGQHLVARGQALAVELDAELLGTLAPEGRDAVVEGILRIGLGLGVRAFGPGPQ